MAAILPFRLLELASGKQTDERGIGQRRTRVCVRASSDEHGQLIFGRSGLADSDRAVTAIADVPGGAATSRNGMVAAVGGAIGFWRAARHHRDDLALPCQC